MTKTEPKGPTLGRVLLVAAAFQMLAWLPLQLAGQQEGAATREGRALRIGVIGSGEMGGGLGQLWAKAGHQILFSSRNPQDLMSLVQGAAPLASAGYPDAAAYFGDVILLAVPPNAIPQIGQDFGHLMRGKVVIDITNPREDRDGPIANEWLAMGTGLAMAQYLPGTRIVKAFNMIGPLSDAFRPGSWVGVAIAGDDEEARSIVAALVRDAGFDPVIVGPLARAKEFDRGTPVWVSGMSAAEVREALKLQP